MQYTGRLAGRVAIVTGGGRGIGKAIALAYADQGAGVAVVARNPREIAATAAEIEARNGCAIAVEANVRDPEAIDRMVDVVTGHFGKIDILFNAAGTRAIGASETLPSAEWQQVVDTNLTGSFLCSQRVFPAMRAQGYGKIIMVGSMQAHSGAPERAAYVASKTGLLGLTRALGVEWAIHGINVNMISPGYFGTDIIMQLIAEGKLDLNAIQQRTPMGRIGRMEDLIGPAVFLASPESDFMCGQSLIIDGGWMAYGFLQM